MQVPSRELRLGSTLLGDARHVCAIFNGREAASAVLHQFVRDGLTNGDDVVYLAEDRAATQDALDGTVNVRAAVDSGQLEIRAWADSYLFGGRFSGSRMLGFIRDALRGGSATGSGLTRLVGEMGWAQDGVPGVEELVAYEAGIDALLAGTPDAVICAYDVRRHTASLIAAVMAVHRAALVGGRLQRTDELGAGTTRDRIMSAASRLFGVAGVRATGVDTLIDAAQVAKATFYRHFPSKDDLIVAWLQDSRTRWLEAIRGQVAVAARVPDQVIPEFFGALTNWLVAGDFRGCPYLNTSAELANQEHPAHDVIRSYLRDVEGYLAGALADAGYRDAVPLAAELQTMVAGAISLGAAYRSESFGVAARDAAIRVLASAHRGEIPDR